VDLNLGVPDVPAAVLLTNFCGLMDVKDYKEVKNLLFIIYLTLNAYFKF
jgi:hypothetical protein